MAEVAGQGHDKECAESVGAVCVCECRGRMHGMRAGRTAKLRRMGQVNVTAVHGARAAAAKTAADRQRNPVTLRTNAGSAIIDVHVRKDGTIKESRAAKLREEHTARVRDAHGVVEGTHAATLRDQQTERIRASKAGDVPDVSPGKGAGATIGREEAYRQMHGDAAGDAKFGPRDRVKPAPAGNSAVRDVEQVQPPEGARPDKAPGSNEPLWKNARTGEAVKYPGKHEITSGVVVRDRQRESLRAAENAGTGDAVELDLFGNPTGLLGGTRNSNDEAKKPAVKQGQQLGMFDAGAGQLDGQGGLFSGMNPDALPDDYDRPTPPQVRPDDVQVPDDLSTLDEDRITELVGQTNDENTLARLLHELDKRESADQYRQVVDAVPDAEAIQHVPDEQLEAHLLDLTSVDHEPDHAALARVEAEMNRREAIDAEYARNIAIVHAHVDEVLRNPGSTDNDLEEAAQMASQIGDEPRLVLLYEEWDRREKAAQAQLDAEHAAREKAAADQLAAEQEAARQESARVAKEQADREALDREFQAMYPSQLSSEYVQNAASMDPAKQVRYAAAEREMQRRQIEKADEDARRKKVERHDRIVRGEPGRLSDAELSEGIANIEADGYNTNSVRQNRLAALREEKAKRDAEHARVDALKAAVPTAPARLRNPIAALGDLKRAGEHDQGVRDRLERARMSALGVPEPEVRAVNEWSGWKEKQKARKAAIAEATKNDPRSAQEQAATIVAHYRHLAKIDNPTIRDGHMASDYERRAQFGPDDQPDAPPLVEAAPFEKIPKSYEAFQELRTQAMNDRAGGNPAGANRIGVASRRALGLPDDAPDDDVRQAYGADERSSGDMYSQMIVEFRALAKSEGVDPDDRLRYGPKEKTPKAPGSPGYRVKPTPAQQAEVDRRVADGEDYIEAYAGVYGLDPDAMRREQGPKLTGPQMKAAYEEHTHLQYLDAEKATAGHLLSPKGKAKNIEPVMLFSGSINQARPYASEELLRYWAQNERLSFADFKANMTGDTAAIKTRASRSNGRDFV